MNWLNPMIGELIPDTVYVILKGGQIVLGIWIFLYGCILAGLVARGLPITRAVVWARKATYVALKEVFINSKDK